MRWIWPLCVVLGCSKPPPPKPPPTEREADKVADIAGRWVANDEMDRGYRMDIDGTGVIDIWIDRGKQGRCEQKGTIAAGTTKRVFRVVYTRGECNPEAVNVPIDMTVTSFTGDQLTIAVGSETRSYQRAPGPDLSGCCPAL
jgi:hypothetical protein